MYRTDFWTLWEKARVGCLKRTASKHVYYLGWNSSPAQVGCMRQVLGPGALGRSDREGGRRGDRDGEYMYIQGWFMSIYDKNHYNIDVILNGIFFFCFFFSDSLLLVCRKATDFCISILYPTTNCTEFILIIFDEDFRVFYRKYHVICK